jgi:hypothetical protein
MQFLKDYGQETLKALFALHGGSIVAVLTFLGALLSKNEAAQLRMAAATLHAVTPGLVSFGSGLLLAVVASGFAYLNFSAHAQLSPSAAELHDWVQGTDFRPRPE